MALDPLRGTLDLVWSRRHERPHPTSLIPHGPIVAEAQKGALERIGEWVAANRITTAGPTGPRVTSSFARVRGPANPAGSSLVHAGEPVDSAARRLIRSLDETVLPVQGPPGAGKTYVGAEMILELVRAGRRVGITAFTHRALTNLLDEVLAHARDAGTTVRAIRKLEKGERAGPCLGLRTTRSPTRTSTDELTSGAASGRGGHHLALGAT